MTNPVSLFFFLLHVRYSYPPSLCAVILHFAHDRYGNIQGDQKLSVHLTITVQKTDDLKMAITEYIRNVDRAISNTVFENTVRRVNKCLENGGGHFEYYL